MSKHDSDAERSTPALDGGSPAEPSDAQRAAGRFRQDLVIRGEAATLVDGQLPPGATHEIVGTDTDGLPILRRRRFSAA